MKTRFFLLLCLLAFLSVSPLFAAIYTVDNQTGHDADYTSIGDAVAAATDGDTLYVIGSPTNYDVFTLNKRLYIFGPGYRLTENTDTQANVNSVNTYCTVTVDGSFSKLCGLNLIGQVNVESAVGVVIERCHGESNSAAHSIVVINNSSGTTIKQCFFTVHDGVGSYSCVRILGLSDGTVISNSRLYGFSWSRSVYMESTTTNTVIQNNVMEDFDDLRYIAILYNATVSNNIIKWGAITSTNCTFNNNVCSADQCPATEGNQQYVDMSTVFVASGSFDAYYMLSEGSPAEGAGAAGVDCGMFGGTDPYVLSGLPPVPRITLLNVPGVASQTNDVPVSVSVQAGN